MSCAITAEEIEMPFGMLSLLGPENHVLDDVHIGATLRIRLNRRWRCGLLSTYFDHFHLLLLGCIVVHVDAAYCYRWSSVVCRSVTIVRRAKTAKPLEMQFGLWTRMGPKEACIRRGVQISPCARTILMGKRAARCKV